MSFYKSRYTGAQIDSLLDRVDSELDPTTGLPNDIKNAISQAKEATDSTDAAKTAAETATNSANAAIQEAKDALKDVTIARDQAAQYAANLETAKNSAAKSAVDAENSAKTAQDLVTEYGDFKTQTENTLSSHSAQIAELEKLNNVYGFIEFSGEDTTGVLGGDFAGLTQEQLQRVYPFRYMYVEDVDAYAKDKSTKLAEKDKFLVMPNFYIRVTSSSTGYLKVEVSNIKYAADFNKVYDADDVKWLHLGCYKADYDSTGTDVFGYLRSRSGHRPVSHDTKSRENTDMAASSWSQANALNHMPYYNIGSDNPLSSGGFRRAEYQDYRIRGAYDWLCFIYSGKRNSQQIYKGMTGYSWNDGNRDIIPEELQLNGATDIFGTGPFAQGEVTSYVDSEEVEQSVADWKRPCKLLGVENAWGLLWENCYGIYQKDAQVLAYKGHAELTASQAVPNDENISNYFKAIGFTLPTESGYQKEVGSANGLPAPKSIGSSESKSVGDYYWYSAGTRTILLGGSWGYGGQLGLMYFLADSSWGSVASNFGFRLSYIS